MTINFQVEGNPGEAVERVRAFLVSDSMRNIAGYEGQRTVREHLQGLDQTRANRMGGRRTHYYGSARRATEYVIEGEDIIISIGQVGMKLHFYGGTVTAGKNISSATGQPTKYLTIPASPAAYGHSARDFPNLIVVWGHGGKPVGLAVAEEANRAGGSHRGPKLVKRGALVPGQMMFWLKESVTMQPDPTVLPTSETLGENIADRVGKAVVRRFGGTSETATDEGGDAS